MKKKNTKQKLDLSWQIQLCLPTYVAMGALQAIGPFYYQYSSSIQVAPGQPVGFIVIQWHSLKLRRK